jgi:uncharacterized protein (TIGR02231 family)
MKRFAPALALAILTVALTPAGAAEMNIPSKVDTVTIFPKGAEIARVFDVKLAPGSHVLVLADLPSAVAENSIRVEGETAGNLEIGSVDARPIVVKIPGQAGTPDDTDRKRIEEEIKALTDERGALDGAVVAATAQKALAENLSRLPLGGQGKPDGASVPDRDWNAIFELIGARIGQAAKTIQEAQMKQRDLDEKIKVLREKLQHEPPEEWERTEVRIYVEAANPVEGRLRVRYQVTEASWQPLYDARLTTGGKNREASLTIARRASITQETGEDWTDADLTLSTTRPGGSTSAPELQPLKVLYRPDPQPMAGAPAPGIMRRFRGEDGVGAAAPDQDAEKPVYNRLRESDAVAESMPYQTSFRIPQRVTIKTGVGQKKVFIAAETPKPSLMVRASPKRDATAYLHAKFTHEGIAPLLPGEVSLYRDGVFTGRGQLPLIAQGEEKELGFGQDDAVKVARIELKRAKGESGIIAASSTDEQHYKITVKNYHDWAMPVTIVDQMPVSEEEKIVVELLPMTTEPSERNYNDKLGLLAWSYELKPQEEKAITLSYELKWPAKREIVMTEY